MERLPNGHWNKVETGRATQHQIDLLREKMENMKTLRADNEVVLVKHEALTKLEAAIDRFQASNEKAIGEFRTENVKAIGELRTDFEKLRTAMETSTNSFTVRMMGGIGLLGVFITILQFFK